LEIYNLYHDGFLVRTGTHTLIFDYYPGKQSAGGLRDGMIDPQELRDENVVVFASHRHPDHFSREILDWRENLPQVRYVLSDDIRTGEDVHKMGPGAVLDLGDVWVRTLESTDEGVAFLVKTDGVCLYHAGDLNWWDWEGEPPRARELMGQRYREQIDLLRGEKIDVAFLPADSRLEKSYLLGMDYFMRTVGADFVVPMHFWDDYAVCTRLQNEEQTADYRNQIASYAKRGQRIL